MKYLFEAIPIPLSGVMLAFFSLGNLLHGLEITIAAHISYFVGMVLFLLLLGKLIFATNSVVAEMQNPIIASVSPTFTMGTLVLSSGLHYYGISSSFSHTLWILAAVTQIFIICYFFFTFIWKKNITIANVFPSWLVLFVGTAVMPLTARDLSGNFTQGIVIFAFCAFVIVAPIVILRGFIRKDLPEPTIPMLAILSAPASLILAAYFEQFNTSIAMIAVLYVIAQLLFFLVLSKLPSMLMLPFYPSYAAMTFPLVISATATNTMLYYVNLQGIFKNIMTTYFYVQLLLAVCIVGYVLIRYLNYLSIQVQAKHHQAVSEK
ncbi:TDT family transporter [Solibacillus daqui]|uniref:TDT family transporter n=1 Tax=Solibacillus daqui TaxID=2912187 RepID=UPI002365E0B9|nr:TDT family transporter [Solibacillus daqui]